MMAAFGSANPEAITKGGVGPQAFVQGIIKELEKLPKAPNAAKNFFENLQDVGFRAFASIGSVLNKVLLPEMNKLVDFVSFLTESGALERITKGFMGIVNVSGTGNPLITIFSYVAATLEEMPKILQGIASLFSALLDKGIMIVQKIVEVLQNVGGSFIGRNLGLEGLANISTGALGDPKKVLAAFQQLGNSKDAIQKRAAGYMADFGTSAAAPNQAQAETSAGGFTVPEALTDIAKTNRKIAENTSEMLDFQTALIGGGQVGQQAFSGLEVAKATGGMSPVHRAAMKFADELNDIMGKNQIRVGRTYGYNR
jgi:hypothetical protein